MVPGSQLPLALLGMARCWAKHSLGAVCSQSKHLGYCSCGMRIECMFLFNWRRKDKADREHKGLVGCTVSPGIKWCSVLSTWAKWSHSEICSWFSEDYSSKQPFYFSFFPLCILHLHLLFSGAELLVQKFLGLSIPPEINHLEHLSLISEDVFWPEAVGITLICKS